MTIENKHAVTVNYKLHTIEANGEKVFVEETNAENPLTYLHGVGMMIPKFEEELNGLTAGDKKSFTVTPEEGTEQLIQMLLQTCLWKCLTNQGCHLLVLCFR